MRAIGVALVASGVLAAAVTAGPAAGASFKACEPVSFTPGSTFQSSHYGANNVRALRTTCSVARKVASKSEGKGASGYVSRGFSCKAGGLSAGVRHWTCKSGRKQVRFTTVGNG
jgi:hypothetical protein